MSVDIRQLIWSAVRAILKFILTALCGFYLARRKLLDAGGTRQISQVILNVFLPCLLFSKIVQGIDQERLPQVGVLVLTSGLYMLIGLLFGFIVRWTMKVPRGWHYGVLAAGAYSNWGDLPLVLIGTIATSPPFVGAADQAKGFAYVAVYIFVQTTVMFAFNGIWLVSKDFELLENSKPAPDTSIRKSIATWLRHHTLFRSQRTDSTPENVALGSATVHVSKKTNRSNSSSSTALRLTESLGMGRRLSRDSERLRPVISGVVETGDVQATLAPVDSLPLSKTQVESQITPAPSTLEMSTRSSLKRSLVTFMQKLVSPPSLATLIAFVVAVIPPVRALFVVTANYSIRPAPDGLPPLDFLMDILDFIGAASVPSSLLILGYSLSRLKITKLPALGAAVLMAVLKMIVLPILAVSWAQGLVYHMHLVPESDLILRLVIILPAAVPTATSLIYITQILAPEDREEGIMCLSVFLIVQYLLLGITLTITVVYALNLIT